MAIPRDHEIHKRRMSRNVGLGVVLLAFAAMVFGLTIVKVMNGDPMEGYDHQPPTAIVSPKANP